MGDKQSQGQQQAKSVPENNIATNGEMEQTLEFRPNNSVRNDNKIGGRKFRDRNLGTEFGEIWISEGGGEFPLLPLPWLRHDYWIQIFDKLINFLVYAPILRDYLKLK